MRAGGRYRPIGWIGYWYVNTHSELAAIWTSFVYGEVALALRASLVLRRWGLSVVGGGLIAAWVAAMHVMLPRLHWCRKCGRGIGSRRGE